MRKVFGNLWVHYEWDEPTDDRLAPGYYFSDDAEQLHGPYEDSGTALAELNAYVAWLEGIPF